MKPIYFDLSVENLEEARRFFEAAFGWKFELFPMPYEYYRITAGAAGEPGIDGGIGWMATCAEPGGLNFGLLEADSNAALQELKVGEQT